jgi:hypothetical protein
MANRYSIIYVDGFPQEISATDRLHHSGNVVRASSAPASPQAGDLWFDTSGGGTLKVYDGSSSWDDAVEGGTTYTPPPISENKQTISSSYSMTANKNGVSVGPITVNDEVVVTVPDGAVWATL